MRRIHKQILFGGIYLGIFLGIAYLITVKIFFPPTCTDGLRNQGEEAVDCGGPCVPCEVKALRPPAILQAVYFPNPAKNTYDLGAEIKNPNASWGSREIEWQFIFRGEEGTVVDRVSGSTYLLPGETRWVIAPAAYTLGKVADIDFKIQQEGIEWQKLKPFVQEAVLRVLNPTWKKLLPPAIGFIEARGEVRNNSSFTLGKVEVNLILLDKAGKVLAIGATVIDDLAAGKTKSFSYTWTSKFSGEIARIEAFAHADFLSDLNFMERYGR
jgi:hypothetical protein